MDQEKIRKDIPCIEKNEYGVKTLYVKGKPFLMLGGELHNSASSNLQFMEKEVWPYLRPLKLNTVILPVAWESIEPEEGAFDFSVVEGLLAQARRENVKLVLLWFGLWKNGESFYVPAWVKEDYRRFFRSRYADGHPSDTVSPLCKAAVEADKKAFAKLMEYLKVYDGEEQTVVMVQVENEIGFLKAERDYSMAAESAFVGEIPAEIAELYQRKGNWADAFGEDAPEYFMAYHYAKAVQTISSAGKEIYPLPMYVNAWLEQHPDRPGLYPSGGPVAKLIPLWKTAAPVLDAIAPDIYLPNFKEVCESYCVCENPLLIPEARRDPVTASNAFYAFGGLNALCFSPFAAEDFLRNDLKPMDPGLLASLNISMRGFNCEGTGPYFQKSCEVLNGILPLITERRGSGKMCGFIKANPYETGCIVSMDGYDVQLDYMGGEDERKPGSAGIIFKEENGFYISGCNVKFKTLPKKGSNAFVTTVRLEEGIFENGVWKPGRVLNGDELSMNLLGEFAETKYVKICVHTA